MDYNEYIYMMCKQTNFANEGDTTETAKWLAKEALEVHGALLVLEDVMKEQLTVKQFDKIITEAGKRLFKQDVSKMREGEFKEFVEKHMEEILND